MALGAVGWLRGLIRRSPEQRYVRRVLKKFGRGERHSTLGLEVRDEAYTRGKAERWAGSLVEYGLKPEHLCVEYGCGSLWAAEPVIRYLQPGRFIGLDITDKFYELGRQRIGALIAEKQARLAVVSRATLHDVAAQKPDFIFSRKVLQHVPDDALPRYLENVVSLMQPKTIVVLENTPVADEAGNLYGRHHTVDDMRRHLPRHIEIRQEYWAAMLRWKA